MNQSNKSLNNWFLILAVLALGIAPLILVRGGKFGGSDDKAKAAITEIQPEYKPWFQSPFVPASGEIASLLFASQAALGAGVVGYAIGIYKGRSEQKKTERMTLKLDTLAYTNQLRRLPPEHKIIFAFTTLIISLCSHPLVQILIVIWMSIWTVIYAKIPAGIYLRLLTFTIVFCLTSLPALMVNGVAISHLEIVKLDAFYGLNFGDFYIYMSRSGSIQAWGILIRALASVSCLYFLMLTVPFTEILQTLRWLRFPVLLTDLLLLMYRFIFILLKTANELWTAQNSRSGYRNWYTSMKSLALLIGQLLQRTLQQYSQFSLGLQARGFAGELRFWYPRRYRLSRRYTIEAICGCVILIGLEICQNAGIFTRI